jgi:hypothetical protein
VHPGLAQLPAATPNWHVPLGSLGLQSVESQQVVYEGGELREDPPLATVTASTSRKQF